MPRFTTRHVGYNLFETSVGEHTVTVDVPLAMGGADRGPTSLQLFVASMGSCVATFVAQYCDSHGIDTTDMAVDVDFDLADGPTRLSNIRVGVTLPHAECGERAAALRRVAEHCPVHQTIAAAEPIAIEIVDRTALAAT